MNIRFILITILATLLNSHTAGADAPSLPAGSVTITEVRASASNGGATSRLQLSIRNHGRTAITLLGVSSPVAGRSRLMGRISTTESVDLRSINIPGDSTVNLGSEHLWVELSQLHDDFSPGERVPVTVRFVQGQIPALAHVH